MEGFGGRLHTAMIAAGVSERDVARERNVSVKTVRNWLEMKEATLSGVHLVGVGMFLCFSVRWLALGVGDPTPSALAERRRAHATM